MQIRPTLAVAAFSAVALLSSCSPHRTAAPGGEGSRVPVGRGGEALVLQPAEGERRVRRPRVSSSTAQTAPFIIKVDARNGGSPDLVMGYEEIAPGEAIQPHRHLVADEIVYVHRGTGVATLGGREATVSEGAALYIPRNSVISVRNPGPAPLGVAFFFSRPGFEQLMRENSVAEGEPATPLSAEEQAAIRERHRWHTIAGAGDGAGDGVPASVGLVLQASQGERRIRRPPPGSPAPGITTPIVLKVDRRNGGSPELVMVYEEVAPGEAILPHRHPRADEIVFVQRGSGLVDLGGRQTAVGAGATIYVPGETRVSVRNTGAEPLALVSVFSRPGPEELMRESSVAEGQPAIPLSPAEEARMRARHRGHTIYEP